MVILSSSALEVRASDEDLGDLPGFPDVRFDLVSSFNADAWPGNFDEILAVPKYLNFSFTTVPDNSNLLSNSNFTTASLYQKEDAKNERQHIIYSSYRDKVEPLPPSSLTLTEAEEVRTYIKRKRGANILTYHLLKTLESLGVCGYDLLKEKVTSEGKKIYSLCKKYLNYGWIETASIGIWSITPKGIFALNLLKAQGFSDESIKLKRALHDEEDNEKNDEVQDIPPQLKKIKLKITNGNPPIFNGFIK